MATSYFLFANPPTIMLPAADAHRVVMACTNCRKRKIKLNAMQCLTSTSPTNSCCQRCTSRGLQCEYTRGPVASEKRNKTKFTSKVKSKRRTRTGKCVERDVVPRTSPLEIFETRPPDAGQGQESGVRLVWPYPPPPSRAPTATPDSDLTRISPAWIYSMAHHGELGSEFPCPYTPNSWWSNSDFDQPGISPGWIYPCPMANTQRDAEAASFMPTPPSLSMATVFYC
ncbi:hypothetical protein FB45DRAFT_868027 [Roridomyces roridus]|uniref:Zn(2)-C6 fungal-type domain-containing protein n=1 Tax=Roridomyces roridus TaxID=1738132 RepID=A0AAD7BS84_9AGAR|nr:hypothetical protein FB45DRAFT_868027 [Roridomyces roridus]